ncbi:ketopantoate reductase family protein [Mitsuokella sp. oral taxon 131]|uniref:ketopantoate reductase family protein n=1 Tax=Mitsuokella sp. oral taxon 131 TaxID=1321780 RepID=UPI00058AE6C5|nr:2-dehydropantoate 2-reductase [Mitsuokella sp. oral taxon 131]
MRFVIVGTGGTGGCLGGYLALAGNDVTFIARGRHLMAIQEKGLTIRTGHRGDIHLADTKACTMEAYQGTPDVLFVCVKYYGLSDAIAFAKRVADRYTLVIPILNVYGTGEVMQQELPEITCLDGCIYVMAQVEAPGIIAQPQKILRVFYGFRPGQDRHLADKAHALEKILKEAGISCQFTEQIRRDALQKFAFVSPLGATGLYYNATSEAFQHAGPEREMFVGMIREVIAIGAAMGITFETDLVETGLKLIDAFKPGLRTSMQRDVLAGGASEFEGLVNRVVALGEMYRVPTPLYETVREWGVAHHVQ